ESLIGVAAGRRAAGLRREQEIGLLEAENRVSEGVGARIEVAEPGPVELPDLLSVIALDAENHVAATVIRARAEQARYAVLVTVPAFRQAVLTIDGEALEVVLENEVDHAANRVGTVSRRSAAGDDLDALDRGRRHRIDVDDTRAVDRRRSAAVEQHEVAVGAELAKANGRGARGVDHGRLVSAAPRGRPELRQRRRELRQLVEIGLEVDRATLLEQRGIHGDDRARRVEVAPGNAR